MDNRYELVSLDGEGYVVRQIWPYLEDELYQRVYEYKFTTLERAEAFILEQTGGSR